MSKHSRSTVLGLAILGLLVVTAPAFAANLFTVNNSNLQGVSGSQAFVPAFISSQDIDGATGSSAIGTGIYIPYLGTMIPCTAQVGSTGNCNRWGEAAVTAWANGVYYDPRFGTPFIPPSGDHHRTGYRMLMQPSFSGGMWLSGFAPLGQRFPFFPQVGTAGIGGDVGQALATASEGGLNGILLLADAHGEPLTTGKFPRYWPHERATWVDTLMVKYTAGNNSATGTGTKFTQSLRSSVGFTREVDKLRWRAMSNLDGAFTAATNINGAGTAGTASDGCGGSGWCEFYATVSGGNVTLFVNKNADGNTDTFDGTPQVITQSTRLDTISALGNGGKVLKTVALSNIEKLPTVIDDRLAQVDTAMDGTTSTEGFSTGGGVPTAQALFMQFQVVSGPNVHSEEGADPYAWVICGDRGHLYGEEDCEEISSAGGGAADAGGNAFAIVYNSNFQGTLGDSVLKRFGRDLNPNRTGQVQPVQCPQGATCSTDTLSPDSTQNEAVYVLCDEAAGSGDTGLGADGFYHSDCVSDPGDDGFYGSTDDGTIYYKEAVENGLRGWIRETNGHAFSFLGADTDGTHNRASDANFGLTTMVEQNIEGFLMSCLGCNPHSLPANQDTVTYTFDWPGNFTITDFPHPPGSSTTLTILNGSP